MLRYSTSSRMDDEETRIQSQLVHSTMKVINVYGTSSLYMLSYPC